MGRRANTPRAHNREASQPAQDVMLCDISAADATPNLVVDDDKPVTVARGLYVGGGGDVKVDTLTQTAQTIKAVPGGTFCPVWITKVYKTGTTATNLLFLF